jgi:hypothetical protein
VVAAVTVTLPRWAAIALIIGWVGAAVTLWWSGYWIASTNAHDDCTITKLAHSEPFWYCPLDVDVDVGTPQPWPVPDPEGVPA